MNTQPRQIQFLEPDEVFSRLHGRKEGLSAAEVQERLQHVGKNSYEVPDRSRWLKSLLRQFTNFFAILLLTSSLICFIAHRINPGEGMNILGWAILGVALLNALFSFFQEYRAERAMAALKAFLPQLVEVRRENAIVQVAATEVVPGDILLLAEGNKITADARVIRAESLQVNNAPLTGEANPCRLVAGPVATRLEESANIAFAGASVLRGSGEAVVFATGLRTEFGKLAHLSQSIRRTDSPLERETARMVRILTVIASCMGLGFFLYGVVIGRPLWVNLVFMMGIIVANVPEGLLPTFTLSLVMGSLRMARKNVLVKSLNAVEALGAVHVICSDKTGTLTQNRLSIAATVDPLAGETLPPAERSGLLTCALAASEVRLSRDVYLGDPLDREIAQVYGEREAVAAFLETIERAFPFDLEKKRSAGIFTRDGQHLFAVKGAFETLRPLLSSVGPALAAGSDVRLRNADQEALASVDEAVARAAGQGHRVLAVASRLLAEDEVQLVADSDAEDGLQEGLEHGLVLHGLLLLEDPLRPEVPAAVAKCHKAGIEVMLITGDHPRTAWAVARSCGIVADDADENSVLTGSMLAGLTIKDLQEKIGQGIRVFARTTPDQKMKIVAALKAMEKVVAMTGDGVNDAPALKAADVGIAMGLQGTDVARESAQIILLDDNFASIVDGVEEGRTVYENIRKFTCYVLASNIPEMLPYLLYILFPVPLALGVLHILSIDLGTDIVPSMGLGQEPPESDIMDKPPRTEKEALLSPGLLVHSYLFLGLMEGLWSLFLFFLVLVDGGWQYGMELSATDPLHRSATGIALASVLLMQIGNLVGRRSRIGSGIDQGLYTNPLILTGICIQVVFSWAVLYWPPLQKVMGTGPVGLAVYGLAWCGIVLIFGADYLRKMIVSRRRL
ncbi:MAG: cation-translocating P-type ATPase [Desulfobulbaceae bacterium]